MPYTYAFRWLTQAMVTLIGFGTGALGLAIGAGGPVRFSAPGFAVARLVPGGCYFWAVVFVLAGALVLFGAWRKRFVLTRVGLFTAAVCFVFFDLGLIASAARDDHTAFTGCVTYAVVAAICLALWGTVRELE